jgi:hypothetical protein
MMPMSGASTLSATSSPVVRSEADEPPRKVQKTFHAGAGPVAPTAEVDIFLFPFFLSLVAPLALLIVSSSM